MEFNYKRNLIKSLLSQLNTHASECASLHVRKIECFISNQTSPKEENVFSYDGKIVYEEKAKGTFDNQAENPLLHDLFEAIRNEIWSKK